MRIVDNPYYFAEKYVVPSVRLKKWDYSSPGYYFVTICTHNKNKYLGKIIDGLFIPSVIGKICEKYWLDIPRHYPSTKLHAYCLMPNHVHGIIQICKQDINIRRDGACPVSTNKLTLGNIAGSFKSAVKKYTKEHNLLFAWQSRYYEHIIKFEKEFFAITKYIGDNVKNWDKDKYR